jgi:hypothetical protein
MDRGAREPNVNARIGRGISAILLLALLLVEAGCHRDRRAGPPLPPPGPVPVERAGENTVPAGEPVWFEPAVPLDEEGKVGGASPADAASPDATPPGTTLPDAKPPDATADGGPEAVALPTGPPPEVKVESGVSPQRHIAPPVSSPEAHNSKPPATPRPVPTESPKVTHVASLPEWAKGSEELVYRVDFIGITMGYARFRYQGKVSIGGKSAYHLNVRAWTSGILSYIYPINDTIDYYLDAETLAPIRQEYTRHEKGKDDVVFYNQETGRITYRYRQTGKIRKEVDTVPSVYDPVSVAYYFRWRDLGVESRPRNMYGGRKLYQISTRILGNERIHTDNGDVDTIAVRPVIRRDGKPDDKGDLKIWFSSDERRVPVRIYAKFRKIKEWTLVGELVRPAGKAGG